MPNRDPLLMELLHEIHTDVREVKGGVTAALTGVEVLKVQVAELQARHTVRPNRWHMAGGLAAVFASMAKVLTLLPFFRHKG